MREKLTGKRLPGMRARGVLLLLLLAAFGGPVFPQDAGYTSRVVADVGGAQVTLLTEKKTLEEGDRGFRLARVLVIRRGTVTFQEKLPHGLVQDIGAQLADLGNASAVVVTVTLQTTDQSGYAYMKLYRLGDTAITEFSDTPAPPASGFTLRAGDPDAAGWRPLKVDVGAGTEPAQFGDGDKVQYLAYDPGKGKYVTEDYTAGFDRKVIEMEYQPDQVLYQLNDDRINMRKSPATTAPVVATLPRDSLFDVVDRTDTTQSIGGKTARWYRIRLKDGNSGGWIFGAFIKRAP